MDLQTLITKVLWQPNTETYSVTISLYIAFTFLSRSSLQLLCRLQIYHQQMSNLVGKLNFKYFNFLRKHEEHGQSSHISKK